MNYLAHAFRYLDEPMYAAGTALPDWMNVINRKNRARRRFAEPVLHDPDPEVAQFAAGVIRHHDDDHWFHNQLSFIQLSSTFAVELRQQLEPTAGHQAGFLGHIIVELLLDAALIEGTPGLIARYYQMVGQLDSLLVQRAANKILRIAEDRFPLLLNRFAKEQFIADYVEDKGLQYRLSGVMRRVGLPELPDLTHWLQSARPRVYERVGELLPP